MRTRESGGHGTRGHAKHPGDLAVSQPLDMTKHERCPEFGRQRLDCPLDAFLLLSALEVMVVTTSVDERFGQLNVTSRCPLVVHGRVDHHPIEPGCERRSPFELRDAREQFHEDLLRHIGRRGSVAAETERDAIDAITAQIEESPERFAITRTAGREQVIGWIQWPHDRSVWRSIRAILQTVQESADRVRDQGRQVVAAASVPGRQPVVGAWHNDQFGGVWTIAVH